MLTCNLKYKRHYGLPTDSSINRHMFTYELKYKSNQYLLIGSSINMTDRLKYKPDLCFPII